jgi:uncharacterized protein
MDFVTAILFFLIALVYSSAGFGGGSLYLAVLGQSGTPVSITRSFALLCNAMVTGVSIWRFEKKKLLPFRRAALLLAFSTPCVIVASSQKISTHSFYLLLAGALMLAGLGILLQRFHKKTYHVAPAQSPRWIYPASAAIGVISGLTGIGGGVYLSPLLYFTRWGNEKEIASTCSLFIAVNSLSGLIGLIWSDQFEINHSLLLLLGAVLLGGLTGSYLATGIFNHSSIRWITAGLLIFAAIRILFQHL